MRYFTFKLDWSSGEGTYPSYNQGTLIEPDFATGDVRDADTKTFFRLLEGEIDVSQFTEWSVEETTLDVMFSEAKILNPNAVLIDGFVYFPVPEIV
jgi:hypothetical protein